MLLFSDGSDRQEQLSDHVRGLMRPAQQQEPRRAELGPHVLARSDARLAEAADQTAHPSIGIVVVAGMSVGTLFTLFVLPAVYTVLAKDHAAAARSVRAKELAQIS